MRWSRVAYAAGGPNSTRGFLAVGAGALEIAIVIQGALEVWSLNLYLLFIHLIFKDIEFVSVLYCVQSSARTEDISHIPRDFTEGQLLTRSALSQLVIIDSFMLFLCCSLVYCHTCCPWVLCTSLSIFSILFTVTSVVREFFVLHCQHTPSCLLSWVCCRWVLCISQSIFSILLTVMSVLPVSTLYFTANILCCYVSFAMFYWANK